MLRTQMMIDKEIKRELEKVAAAEGVSMAKLTRKFIKEGLERKRKKRAKRKRTLGELILEMAKKAGKHKGSGIGDLAQRHDYYLYGEGRIK